MNLEAGETPLLVARAVPVPRQFRLVGGIQSLAIALFLGFLALIALKFGADAVLGRSSDGNLPFASRWSAVAAGAAFAALLGLHHQVLIVWRSRTSYLVFPDRVEIRREGVSRPLDVVPLARTIAVQSWTGPPPRPLGPATLTLVEEEPAGPSGHPRHVFHPLPNVDDPEAVAELIRSRLRVCPGSGAEPE